MTYDLGNGTELVIVQHAVIGEPQDSLVDWVKQQVENGYDEGDFVEGHWYVIKKV